MKRFLFALCLAAAATRAAAVEAPLRVVALTTVLAEIAAEVGGPQVAVTGLLPPGVDPHTFNPSPADIRAVVDADVVLASGLRLEAYLDRIVRRVGPGGRIVSVGEQLPVVLTLPGPAGAEPDPHWWHSLTDMEAAVGVVQGVFSAARPGFAGAFAARAGAYRARLEALRAWSLAELSVVPADRRRLVTSHDAFGYLARDYGFKVYSINGLSTDSEADGRHLASLVDMIRRERVPSVFAESSANPRVVANLLGETGARLGGTLYADGLGPAGGEAADYVSMYRHNVRALAEGLGGPAPR